MRIVGPKRDEVGGEWRKLHNIFAMGKQQVLNIISTDIRHANRIRPTILSSVACLAVPYFFHTIS